MAGLRGITGANKNSPPWAIWPASMRMPFFSSRKTETPRERPSTTTSYVPGAMLTKEPSRAAASNEAVLASEPRTHNETLIVSSVAAMS